MTTQVEQRCIRFTDIAGLERADLPIAGEIWLKELCSASWSTRDMMKLGVHFIGYVNAPNPRATWFREIENLFQLNRDGVLQALSAMRIYGAVDAFSSDGQSIKVALKLSWLQRLAALEAVHRLHELEMARKRMKVASLSVREKGWTPPAVPGEDALEDVPGEVPVQAHA